MAIKWPMEIEGSKKLINTPKPPSNPSKKKKKQNILEHFSGQILSLFLSKFSPKHIKEPLVPLFSQQSRGSVLVVFFLSLVLGPWI